MQFFLIVAPASPTTNGEKELDINKALVCGTIAAGLGYKQLSTVLGGVNLPIISPNTQISYQNVVIKNSRDIAIEKMIQADREEYKLAVEAGELINGVPVIAIVVDGAQSKRSYNSIFKNGKIIDDGDSSVYKKLRDSNPYGLSLFIEKIQ